MLESATRWRQIEVDEREAFAIASKLKLSLPLARLLVGRGFRTREEIEAFLEPDRFPIPSSFLLPDMELGRDRILKAIENGEKILVYGDYDTDGVMSTTLMHHLLTSLGASFSLYIPNRFREGYGFHRDVIHRAAREGVRLIITVDTGITAIDEVMLARELGIDVVITDHHEPPERLPEAVAVINPKRSDSRYPYPELCGAGVALKLAYALMEEVPEEWWIWSAIGTIADLVPLTGENRVIATRGLQAIQHAENRGLKALLVRAGLEGRIDAASIGYGIAPRINAAGRLSDASISLRLFTTADGEEAVQLAEELERLNERRQVLTDEIYLEAEKEALRRMEEGLDKVLVVAGHGWHEGVIGIVASRLVERFYRPAIVLSIDPDRMEAKGSGRSIPGFDLYQQLTKVKDLLLKYGGHTLAAGLTLEEEKIPELRHRLNEQGRLVLTDEDLKPITRVDLKISLKELTLPFLAELERFQPFGMGNPEPIFLIRNAEIESIKRVGREGNHLKWRLRQDGVSLDAVAFHQGDKEELISPSSHIHMVGEVAVQEWNGRKRIQFIIRDMMIPEIQIFDRRGKWERIELVMKIPKKTSQALLYFRARSRLLLEERKDEIGAFLIPVNRKGVPLYPEEIPYDQIRRIILFDLPETFTSLESIRRFPNIEELWLLFREEERRGFPNRLPSREEMIRFYSLLLERKGVAIGADLWDIEKRSRLSKEMISFLLRVFSELQLIRVEDQRIYAVKTKEKRPLDQSETYIRLKEILAVEERLLFSTPREILEWLIKGRTQRMAEEGIG